MATGWQAVVAALKAEGVKYVFGLPGSANDLYDALYDEPAIRPILVRHEAAGGFMAMAFALLTGEPAVCHAGQGPGIANLAPALLECLATCAPVIAPCPGGDGHHVGKGAFQEMDQMGLMRPVTKWAFHVPHADKVPWAMRRAFSLATNGQPGPVFVEIAREAGRAAAETPSYVKAERRIRCTADPERLRQAALLLAGARRPVIVAGGGARASGAHAEVQALAELLGMPVMTTPSGRGSISEEHPLSIGQVGLYRTRLGMQALDEADVLMTVGSRNEEFQSGAWKLFPAGAKYIQVDIAPFELGRNWIPDVALLGDAKLVLADLLLSLEGKPKRHWKARGKQWARAKAAYEKEVAVECLRDEMPLKTKRVVFELNRVFGHDTILVHENGSQDLWTYYHPYYRVLDRNGVVAPGEQTCMGAGVCAAIGAKLACPDRKVVCVTGDGAFQMYNQDVPTAVQYKAPVTWVVLNSFSLGWPRYTQKRLGERYIATDYSAQPDFVTLAHAYGCYGERVEAPDQVRPALEHALRANAAGQPAILNCIIDAWDYAEGFHAFQQVRPLGSGRP